LTLLTSYEEQTYNYAVQLKTPLTALLIRTGQKYYACTQQGAVVSRRHFI